MIATRFNPLGIRPKTQAMRYIQDSMTHQWDAIENVGYGIHDNSSRTWKDLVGNVDLTLGDDASFGDTYAEKIVASGRIAIGDVSVLDSLTIEAVFLVEESWVNNAIIFLGGANHTSGLLLRRYGNYVNIFCDLKGDTSGRTRRLNTTITNFHSKVRSLAITSPNTSLNPLNLVLDNGNKATVTIGYTSGFGSSVVVVGGDGFIGKLCTIRTHSRELTKDELEFNLALDVERFGIQL